MHCRLGLYVVWVGVAAAGCDGQVVLPSAPKAPDGTSARCEVGPGRVIARRLTRLEYNNTVRDLFTFDTGHPADDFPDDVTGGDAVNNTGLTVSDLFFEKNEIAVTALAEQALAHGFVKCDPAAMDKHLCARQTLEPFMRRAWRRPVSAEEVDAVVSYVDQVAAETGESDPFGQAIKLGIEHVLLSANFLFRFELLADPQTTAAQPLDSYALASRLSYFIFGSMPDDALFAAAKSDALLDATQLEAQVRRMLADPKARHLVEKLAGEWLWANRVDWVNPKASLYPNFDATLRQSLKQETTLFVNEFLQGDHDYRDLLDADFTFANARLANHYGLPDASGFNDTFVKTSLASTPERGGILTQGALLAATSAPLNIPTAEIAETNVIVRGKFVLQYLLSSPLPSPPANLDIAQIQADAQKDIPPGAPRKVREGVRQQTMPCAGCHVHLDPIGFSMEHFDVTGAWRTHDGQQTAVDSTGVLKDNEGNLVGSFEGARSLGTLLKKDPRFSSSLARAVFTAALGRTATTEEQCRLQRLGALADERGHRLSELIVFMTQDSAFTQQQGEAP